MFKEKRYERSKKEKAKLCVNIDDYVTNMDKYMYIKQNKKETGQHDYGVFKCQ